MARRNIWCHSYYIMPYKRFVLCCTLYLGKDTLGGVLLSLLSLCLENASQIYKKWPLDFWVGVSSIHLNSFSLILGQLASFVLVNFQTKNLHLFPLKTDDGRHQKSCWVRHTYQYFDRKQAWWYSFR